MGELRRPLCRRFLLLQKKIRQIRQKKIRLILQK